MVKAKCVCIYVIICVATCTHTCTNTGVPHRYCRFGSRQPQYNEYHNRVGCNFFAEVLFVKNATSVRLN